MSPATHSDCGYFRGWRARRQRRVFWPPLPSALGRAPHGRAIDSAVPSNKCPRNASHRQAVDRRANVAFARNSFFKHQGIEISEIITMHQWRGSRTPAGGAGRQCLVARLPFNGTTTTATPSAQGGNAARIYPGDVLTVSANGRLRSASMTRRLADEWLLASIVLSNSCI